MVTPPPGLTRDQMEQAELLVAAELGLATLEEHRHTFVAKPRAGVVTLPTPASDILSVTAGDDELCGTELRAYRYLSVGVTTPVEVIYRAGWTADTLPPQIASAVVITARSLASPLGQDLPAGVQSIRLPEISLSFHEQHVPTGGVPKSAQRLLSPWMPVRW